MHDNSAISMHAVLYQYVNTTRSIEYYTMPKSYLKCKINMSLYSAQRNKNNTTYNYCTTL